MDDREEDIMKVLAAQYAGTMQQHQKAARVVMLVADGWKGIAGAPKKVATSKRNSILLRAYDPETHLARDVESWWTGQEWARWPYPFPPTHWKRLRKDG